MNQIQSIDQFQLQQKKTNKNQNTKNKYFLANSVYCSIDINTHNLLYLMLLVKQQQVPKHVLNICLFSSQSCELIFRNTRSLNGVFSTIVNFTVRDFLRRAEKLSMLQQVNVMERQILMNAWYSLYIISINNKIL